jgi:Uma2 family endonuclease
MYQDEHVPEYWIVDLDARLFERWRPGDTRPEVLTETLTWQPESDAPPLTIDLAEYFARVHGD